MSTDITTVPLTSTEETRLLELEVLVENGLDTFVKVGTALAEIQTFKLYRQTHDNFADYLEDRFGISRSRGYQLIDSARLSTMVDNAGLPPIQNERQARALSGLDDQDVLTVYQNAVAETAGRPTTRSITEAARRVVPSAPKVEPKPPRRRPLPAAWRNYTWKLHQATTSLRNLTTDDRFRSNADGLERGLVHGAVRDLQAVVAALGMGELVLLSPAVITMSRSSEVEFETALQDARADGDLSAEAVAARLAATETDDNRPTYTPSTRRPITIVSGPNTAFVGYEHPVSEAIKRLRITAMPDRDTRKKRRCISAEHLDDLVAALEADGHRVDLVVEQ